jgi:acetyl-CoA C-acetyltransferase
MKRNRNVAISGIGQTKHRGHRPDVNQAELVWEAVEDALADARINLKDIDCVVHGNMELFEGIHQPDMWHVLGSGAFGKSGIRVTTGGTTGASVSAAADHLVASGLYDTVLAIGFEKQEEGQTTTGITAMADPLWGREVQTGAITGTTGLMWVNEFGERAEWAAAKTRVKAAKNACRNPKAHLRIQITEQDVMNSRLLAFPLRLLHMCPESNGVCAMIYASEEQAKRYPRRPVWIKDHITVHREETFHRGPTARVESKVAGTIDNPSGVTGLRAQPATMEVAATTLFKRNGITNPLRQIDLFEMYDPSSWWEIDWTCLFLGLERETVLNMIEKGEFEIEGSFPINPSGGVVSTNPIGATALIRVAEAALQIRGDAGEHQVPKDVKTALASGFGGTLWTVLHLLVKEL